MAKPENAANRFGWSAPGTNAADTVFLLGSGLNANSWVPVISAVREFYPHADASTPEHANFVLAWWVYHQRTRALRMQKGMTEEERKRNEDVATSDLGLRQTIAASIRVASDQRFFMIRRNATAVLGDRKWGDTRFYLTTNWDRMLEADLGLPSSAVTHIHGEIEKPSCLYLPSETSTEPYRTDDANKHIALLTGTAWQVLRDAKQVCIYGLSLSPLDAELSAIVGVGLEPRDGPPLPVYVYNVREALDETVWRVRALTHPESKVDIRAVVVEPEPDPVVPSGWDLRQE